MIVGAGSMQRTIRNAHVVVMAGLIGQMRTGGGRIGALPATKRSQHDGQARIVGWDDAVAVALSEGWSADATGAICPNCDLI